MLAAQFAEGVAAARTLAQVEAVARLLWKAHGQGAIGDSDATALAEALEGRRARLKAGRPATLPSPSTARRRPAPRSPDRQASLARRRRVAASGCLPPGIAANFTLGEQSVLAVIAYEVRRSGRCEFCIDKIAALAGTCRTVVQNTLREAKRLGLLTVTERRRRGAKSLTNVCAIISPEWKAWLRIGFRKTHPTDTDSFLSLAKPAATGPKRAFEGGASISVDNPRIASAGCA
jgi:hypothetical protein